ncbi:hypothetical protein QL285_082766 [Trifolium repens]|nr:hypothetical protein QL285_082766 [Trifolium repens]
MLETLTNNSLNVELLYVRVSLLIWLLNLWPIPTISHQSGFAEEKTKALCIKSGKQPGKEAQIVLEGSYGKCGSGFYLFNSSVQLDFDA